MTYNEIINLIGKEEESLFSHECKTIPKQNLHLPGSDFIDRIVADSNRNNKTLCNLNSIFKLEGLLVLAIFPSCQSIKVWNIVLAHLSVPTQCISILKIF
jgi:class I fructose-bisphosphate aldolase